MRQLCMHSHEKKKKTLRENRKLQNSVEYNPCYKNVQKDDHEIGMSGNFKRGFGAIDSVCVLAYNNFIEAYNKLHIFKLRS